VDSRLRGNDSSLLVETKTNADLSVKGIDLIRLDDDGLIVEFEVFIRPANGLQALGEAMARRLA